MQNLTEAELTMYLREWESTLKPLWFAETENNFNLMKKAIHNRIIGGAPIDAKKIQEIVENFAKYGQSNGIRGRLDVVQILAPPNPADDLPHGDDPQLKWLDSKQALAEVTPEKMKRFTQNAAKAESTRDESGKTLYERYNERVAYLMKNNVQRVKKSEQPQQPTGLPTENNVAIKEAMAALAEIRASIDAIRGFSSFVKSSKERLHRTLNQLITDQKSMPEIQKIMAHEIENWDDAIR